MTTPSPSGGRAGGFILAASILIGGVVGMVLRQPSAGVVVGIAIGALAAIGIWLADRRRR